MSRFFRSVGARLSLALLLVVAIALGVVYLAVVPSLENRLVNTRISQLEVAARKLGPRAAKQTQVIPQKALGTRLKRLPTCVQCIPVR